MNKVIAIDVVLLPPKEISDWAKKLSKDANKGKKPIILLDNNHIPHISLAMAGINEDNLNKLKSILSGVAEQYNPLELKIRSVETDTNGFQGMLIEKNERLLNLHKLLVNKISSISSKPNINSIYVDPDEMARPFTVAWVDQYNQDATGKNFEPHITLGGTNTISGIKQATFSTDRLAIAHLGNWCTCRKILAEWQLK